MKWMAITTVSLTMLALAGCDAPATTQPAPQPAPPPTASAPTTPAVASTAAPVSSLTRVADPSTVCMVNDQFMGSPQIPVAVGGKTYFGCCAMCKQKLENNESARMATDPVSGKRVDKSSAVIAKNAAGKVFYFESEANLRSYAAM